MESPISSLFSCDNAIDVDEVKSFIQVMSTANNTNFYNSEKREAFLNLDIDSLITFLQPPNASSRGRSSLRGLLNNSCLTKMLSAPTLHLESGYF